MKRIDIANLFVMLPDIITEHHPHIHLVLLDRLIKQRHQITQRGAAVINRIASVLERIDQAFHADFKIQKIFIFNILFHKFKQL